MKKITIIGPCSKYVDGQGWTTEIPVQLLEEQGFKKLKDDQVVVSEKDLRLLKHCHKFIETYKMSLGELSPAYNANPNAQSQDKFKCKHIECNMDGNYCKINKGHGYNWCRIPYKGFCKYYEREDD